MIDAISERDLRRLVEFDDGYCVSIYIPTHRLGSETAQDPIRLKNALIRVIGELEALGVRRAETERLLASAAALDCNRAFWAHGDLGLAVFISQAGTKTYRLPAAFDELVVVADHFHLQPLLPVVATGEIFYVLVVSANEIRLLRGSRFGVSELALGDIPASLADALWFTDRQAQLQSHAAGRVGTGGVAATFHGQGASKDTRGVDLDRFFAEVDEGVRQILADGHAPLVLAGVGDTVSHYRHVTKYPYLVEGSIAGSAEGLLPAELHDRAWPLVEPVFTRAQDDARHAFLADAQRSVKTLSQALVAAREGRVAALFIPLGVHCWGHFHTDRQIAEMHGERQPGDRDLIDVVAIETLTDRGDVFVVDRSNVPGDGPVAALLRF